MDVRFTLAGYHVSGEADLLLWGDDEGSIPMYDVFIAADDFGVDALYATLNDGGFGCQRITGANICVQEVWESDSFGRLYGRVKEFHLDPLTRPTPHTK